MARAHLYRDAKITIRIVLDYYDDEEFREPDDEGFEVQVTITPRSLEIERDIAGTLARFVRNLTIRAPGYTYQTFLGTRSINSEVEPLLNHLFNVQTVKLVAEGRARWGQDCYESDGSEEWREHVENLVELITESGISPLSMDLTAPGANPAMFLPFLKGGSRLTSLAINEGQLRERYDPAEFSLGDTDSMDASAPVWASLTRLSLSSVEPLPFLALASASHSSLTYLKLSFNRFVTYPSLSIFVHLRHLIVDWDEPQHLPFTTTLPELPPSLRKIDMNPVPDETRITRGSFDTIDLAYDALEEVDISRCEAFNTDEVLQTVTRWRKHCPRFVKLRYSPWTRQINDRGQMKVWSHESQQTTKSSLEQQGIDVIALTDEEVDAMYGL